MPGFALVLRGVEVDGALGVDAQRGLPAAEARAEQERVGRLRGHGGVGERAPAGAVGDRPRAEPASPSVFLGSHTAAGRPSRGPGRWRDEAVGIAGRSQAGQAVAPAIGAEGSEPQRRDRDQRQRPAETKPCSGSGRHDVTSSRCRGAARESPGGQRGELRRALLSQERAALGLAGGRRQGDAEHGVAGGQEQPGARLADDRQAVGAIGRRPAQSTRPAAGAKSGR